jgi:LPXTG-motif cell wall-anchored protein
VKTRNSIWRMMVAGSVVVLATLLVPSMASAQDAPESCAVDIADYEGTAIVTIDPLTVTPGGTVTLTGSGFPPGVTVPLMFNGEEFAAPVTDETGSFSVVFTVPADTPEGAVTFEAVCGAFTLSAGLTISSGGVPPGGLPATGSDSTFEMLRLAMVLLATGALLVFLARRQSQRRRVRESLSV